MSVDTQTPSGQTAVAAHENYMLYLIQNFRHLWYMLHLNVQCKPQAVGTAGLQPRTSLVTNQLPTCKIMAAKS